MADDVSTGELNRRLDAHEQRTHAALDGRVTDLAKDMVPQLLFQQSQREMAREVQRLESEHDEAVAQLRREHAEDIRQVRGEIRDLRERPNMTLGRWLAVLSVVAAFATLAVMAWGTLRGAKP